MKRHPSRRRAPQAPDIDPLRARHLSLARHAIGDGGGTGSVLVDEAESPLAWLARRKGRDGRALIEPVQLLAGERLRSDFTRAQMMPRLGVDLGMAAAGRRRHGAQAEFGDSALAARQRVHLALDAAGPEFAGVLVDVCCFLKSVPDVERDRSWPARSGKVVLQLGLDRLARHYGLETTARGPAHLPTRSWHAPDESAAIDADAGQAQRR